MPFVNVTALSEEEKVTKAKEFAENSAIAVDSELLFYADSSCGASDPELKKKIQDALNSATSGKLSNAVSKGTQGNPVKDMVVVGGCVVFVVVVVFVVNVVVFVVFFCFRC